eukprot:6462922-Pyramimonas_sp.AAC.2
MESEKDEYARTYEYGSAQAGGSYVRSRGRRGIAQNGRPGSPGKVDSRPGSPGKVASRPITPGK